MRAAALALLLGLFATSCHAPERAKTYRIGFSQCTGGDLWRQTMLSGMRRELSLHPELELVYQDGKASLAKSWAPTAACGSAPTCFR
ncbi:MAG TPA: hypothetical protein VF630_19825 [Hymenobacter sp.]